MLRTIGLSLATGLLCTVTSLAAPMDWTACVQLAKQNNPDLKASESGVEKASSQNVVAKSGFYPVVTASANTSVNGDLDQNPTQAIGAQARRDDPTKDYSLSLNIKQSLYSGKRDQYEVKRSEAVLQSAHSDVDLTRNNLYLELRQNFDLALYYHELVALNRKTLDRRRQNVKIVKLRYDGGHEHKGSLLKSEAAVAQAELDLIEAERAYHMALSNIEKSVGSPLPPDTTIVGKLREPTTRQEPDFKSILLKSPTRAKAEAQVKAAEATVVVERSAYFPDLAAVGSVTRTGGIDTPNDDRYSVGLTLTVPLYNGNKTPANVRSAVAELSRNQYLLSATEQKTMVEIKQAYTNLIDAKDRVIVQGKFVNASTLQAEITRSRYTLGLVTFQEWDVIENELFANEKNLLASRKEAALALAGWEHAQGMKLEDVPR